MKQLFTLITLFAFGNLWSQERCSNEIHFSNELKQQSKPFTHDNFQNDPCRFQFAIVTDRTGGHRPGVFMDGVNKLNLMQPEFVMSVGDLIEGYTLDTVELDKQWDEFESFVTHLEMPFFYLPGNHDITNGVMKDVWMDRFGADYYHFIYKDVLFLCLNSEDQARGAGRGTISDTQFEYAKKVLDETKEVRWTLVFMHQPLWHQKNTERWEELETILAGRKHTVYAGHEHRYVKETRNDGKYFTLATTGGGSSLRGPELGEFDHMMWVTMTDDGPIMANLALNGIWNEDVVTERTKVLIEKFSAHSPIEIEPPYYKDGMLSKRSDFRIRLTNDENIPMTFSLESANSKNLALFLPQAEITVAPNSTEVLDLKLLANETSTDGLEPAQLKLNMALGVPGEPALISYPYKYAIKPLPKLPLKRAGEKPIIDGRTEEWGDLHYHFEANGGEMMMDFEVAHDDLFVYVAARVKDSEVESYGEGASWRQDNLSIVINAREDRKAAVSVGHDWYRNEFIQQLSPANESVASVTYRDNLPRGTVMYCLQTDYGYEGELAIPISYFKSLQGDDWKSLRLNIGVDDKDGNRKVQRYGWMPAWRNADNYVGSGMFFISEELR